MSTSAPDLAERYGASAGAGRRRVLVAGVVALVLVSGAWLAWAMVFHSTPRVTSQLVGYDVRGPHEAAVTFTVDRRDADVAASCRVRALAADHAVVGEVAVSVDSGPTRARMRSTLRTEREATSVEVVGCTAPGQTAPR